MGAIVLSDFRDDVQAALGERNLLPAALNRYVNYGYQELTGAIKFEELEADENIVTVASQAEITPLNSFLTVRFVKDLTNDNLLQWVPKAEYYRRSSSLTGVPEVWTRHAGDVLLHPLPSGVFSIFIAEKIEPTLLSADADVTVIPSAWDQAVFLLSVHYGLLGLGEEQRASVWLSRAVAYAQSRLTEEDLDLEMVGKNLAWGGGFLSLLQAAQQQQVNG